jgi:hypothetical protein
MAHGGQRIANHSLLVVIRRDDLASANVSHQEIVMTKFGTAVGAALIASALLVPLSGCQKQEGPAQKAGKDVDKAMEKAGEKVEKAGEAIQDAAKDAKK